MTLPIISDFEAIAIVPDSFDLSDGVETIFGKRCGGDVIRLSTGHLAALQSGQTLAVDVQNEYVIFLKAAKEKDPTHAE